jgi:hypothetical protein
MDIGFPVARLVARASALASCTGKTKREQAIGWIFATVVLLRSVRECASYIGMYTLVGGGMNFLAHNLCKLAGYCARLLNARIFTDITRKI